MFFFVSIIDIHERKFSRGSIVNLIGIKRKNPVILIQMGFQKLCFVQGIDSPSLMIMAFSFAGIFLSLIAGLKNKKMLHMNMR